MATSLDPYNSTLSWNHGRLHLAKRDYSGKNLEGHTKKLKKIVSRPKENFHVNNWVKEFVGDFGEGTTVEDFIGVGLHTMARPEWAWQRRALRGGRILGRGVLKRAFVSESASAPACENVGSRPRLKVLRQRRSDDNDERHRLVEAPHASIGVHTAALTCRTWPVRSGRGPSSCPACRLACPRGRRRAAGRRRRGRGRQRS